MVGVTPEAPAPSRAGRLSHPEARAEPKVHPQALPLDASDIPLTIGELSCRRSGISVNIKRSTLHMQVRAASNVLASKEA